MKTTQVKLNAVVSCPTDMGQAGYKGHVRQIGETVNKNHLGAEYVWVTVQHPSGTKHVWPSNRLQ